MKEISFKKVLIVLVVLIIAYIAIDALLNWEEAKSAFNQGYNDMNTINEQRSKEHLK